MTPRQGTAAIARSVESKGIYSLSAASALLGEEAPTIRRWAFGYARRGSDYAAAIRTEAPVVDGTRVLTFLELVELMFVQGLLRSGLSWPKVREATRTAARLLRDEPHPFATRRWFVDAAALYLQLGSEHDEQSLIEVAGAGQVSMEPVLRQYLTQLDFDAHGVAQRWYPKGQGTPVVLDPRRSFGMPIVTRGGIPTDVLSSLHRAGDSVASIAAWYRIDEVEVDAAVSFEASLRKVA